MKYRKFKISFLGKENSSRIRAIIIVPGPLSFRKLMSFVADVFCSPDVNPFDGSGRDFECLNYSFPRKQIYPWLIWNRYLSHGHSSDYWTNTIHKNINNNINYFKNWLIDIFRNKLFQEKVCID